MPNLGVHDSAQKPALLMSRCLAHRLFSLSLLWVAGMVALASNLRAQTVYTWSGGASNNNWTVPENWSGGTAPSSDTNPAVVFSGSVRLAPDLNAARTVGSLTFSNSAGAFVVGSSGSYALTLGSGGITNLSSNTETLSLRLDLTASQTWTTSAGPLAITGVVHTGYNNLTISGSGNTILSASMSGGSSGNTLTKSGTGTLTLSGNNSGLGHTLNLTGGNLVLANSYALGSATWGNVIASGSALHLQNNISVTEGSFSVAGTGAGAVVNDSGTNTLSAQLNLTGATTISSTAGTLTLTEQINTGSSTLTLAGAGNLTVSGQIGGSGNLAVTGSGTTSLQTVTTNGNVTLGGSGTVNVTGQLSNAASLTVSNSGTSTLSGSVNVSGPLSVTGSGNTTFTQNVSASGAVSVTGSGDTTFGGSLGGTSVTLGGTGDTTVAGAINASGPVSIVNSNAAATVNVGGSINAGSNAVTVNSAATVNLTGGQINTSGGLTVSGTGVVNATSTLNLGGANLTVGGTVDATFSGAQINVGAITISSNGSTTFDTAINATSLVLAGGGETTLAGSGNNYIGSVTVNSGELVLDKESGYAVSNAIIVNGGTLTFADDNQTSTWTDVTLSDSATLVLNDTTQRIDTLVISGDTVIDFASGGSTLSVGNIVFADSSSSLTVLNWSSAVDTFIAFTNPGSTASQVVFDGYPGASWDNYDSTLTPGTPVPEPGDYGFMLLAAGGAFLGWRRWCNRRSASTIPVSAPPLPDRASA